ncbi:MAG: hypothetical protein QHH01_07720 [Spirochaetales bacterium]|nr:hypothetical protein [Spirochaetales bacterium]
MKRHLLCACCLLAVMTVFSLDFQIASKDVLIPFGTLVQRQTLAQTQTSPSRTALVLGGSMGGLFPASGILLAASDGMTVAPMSGAIVYAQVQAPASVFSYPLGGMLAVMDADGFLGLIAGLDSASLAEDMLQEAKLAKGKSLRTASEGEGTARSSEVRLFDTHQRIWLDPCRLVSWQADTVPPAIGEIQLVRKGSSPVPLIEAKGRTPLVTELAQATYELLVQSWDRLSPTALQQVAPYRFVARLDGSTIVDVNFAMARAFENGLSFLGADPPSATVAKPAATYRIGTLQLMRGRRELEIIVEDRKGNVTAQRYILMIR